MKKLFALPALATVLCFAAPSGAGAWERSVTVTGVHGMSSASASGSCSGGTCSRSVTRVGPHGGMGTRTVTRIYPYPYAYPYPRAAAGSVTRTGPYGGTVSRSFTASR